MPFFHEKPESNIIKRYVLYTCIKNLKPNIDPYRYQDYTLVCRLRRTMMIIIIFTDYFHFRVFTLTFFFPRYIFSSLRFLNLFFQSVWFDCHRRHRIQLHSVSRTKKSFIYTNTRERKRDICSFSCILPHALILYTCSPNSSIFFLGWMSEIANVSANSIQY